MSVTRSLILLPIRVIVSIETKKNPGGLVKFFSARAVAEGLSWEMLVPAIAEAFRNPPVVPLRGHYDIDANDPGGVTLLTMPAWRSGDYIGVKLVNVVPKNSARNIPTVVGTYVLMSAVTGEALAIIDCPELTARRTAAASALAASKLARTDARHHLVAGAGKLAPYLARAMRTVRPIEKTTIWARNPDRAAAVADDTDACVAEDLEAAVRQADIISCVTTATRPVVKGAWLSPGTHLDLIGAFRPDMREVDDDAVRCASLFVDTRDGALHEAGELLDPISRGVVSVEDVRADLAELVAGNHPGRQSEQEITLFKSVGTAIEDYAAAVCLLS
jgi:ornithine cyclodeaminase